jgi:hypothetical protein
MADNQNDSKEEGPRSYASRHPMRMHAGSAMVGTAIGAGLMAAKIRREKTPMQKFFDRMNHMSK